MERQAAVEQRKKIREEQEAKEMEEKKKHDLNKNDHRQIVRQQMEKIEEEKRETTLDKISTINEKVDEIIHVIIRSIKFNRN